jgi:hypothetical protein
VNSKSASNRKLAFRVISQPQSSGEEYVRSMFPSPNRALVNFAHSGFVKGWSWDDEGKPHSFLYVMFVPE